MKGGGLDKRLGSRMKCDDNRADNRSGSESRSVRLRPDRAPRPIIAIDHPIRRVRHEREAPAEVSEVRYRSRQGTRSLTFLLVRTRRTFVYANFLGGG